MAHRLQDLVIKLNGARDEQSGMWWLARHAAGLLFLDSRYRVVRDVVRRTGLALVCVGCVQLELRSLVKMSRDETQAGLRSHFAGGLAGSADGQAMVKCGDMDDVGATDRDWCLGTNVRLSAGPSVFKYSLCRSNRRVVGAGKCCDFQLAANRKTCIDIGGSPIDSRPGPSKHNCRPQACSSMLFDRDKTFMQRETWDWCLQWTRNSSDVRT